MFSRFFGQRNPEKDIERILVDLQGSSATCRWNFVQANLGWETGTQTVHMTAGGEAELPSTGSTQAVGNFRAPYSGTITIYAVVYHIGVARLANVAWGGKCGESTSATSLSYNSGAFTDHTGSANFDCIYPMTGSVDANEFMSCNLSRDGDHANDTGGNLTMYGWYWVYS